MRTYLVHFLISVIVCGIAWLGFAFFEFGGLPRGQDLPSHEPTDSKTSPLGAIRNRIESLVKTREPSSSETQPTTARSQDQRDLQPESAPKLRVGTFNLHAFTGDKARKRHVIDIVARIVREFDVLAVQEIQSAADDTLPNLVHLVNRTGQQYDYAIGERVGPTEQPRQYGFIFNRKTVVLDRSELYTVDDRDNLLAYEPFVGWFRARGTTPDTAFTFSLVNLQIDPTTAVQERDVLDEILFAVRDDGRNEDDVILLGDLQAGPGALGDLDKLKGIGFAVVNVPTNVEATAMLDNLVFQKSATSEFTGRAGVFDFLRQYNLDLEDALEVSDHLPVWAEFTIFEGGEVGRVATSLPSDGNHQSATLR